VIPIGKWPTGELILLNFNEVMRVSIVSKLQKLKVSIVSKLQISIEYAVSIKSKRVVEVIIPSNNV